MINLIHEIFTAYQLYLAAPSNSPLEEKALATLDGWISLYSEDTGLSKESIAISLVIAHLESLMEVK